MTFVDLQDRVMDRLNLSSDDARTRVKNFLNDRMRRLQTSCNLGMVRRGTVQIDTVADQSEYGSPIEDKTVDTVVCIKPLTLTIDGLVTPLGERTFDQVRNMPTASGKPTLFYLKKYTAESFAIGLYPVPDGIYEITIDGLLAGVDMSADDDVPAFPEDFHDALIFGAMADEYDHYDKADLAVVMENKYEKRIGDLRYFIHKSIYLQKKQNGANTPTLLWWRV